MTLVSDSFLAKRGKHFVYQFTQTKILKEQTQFLMKYDYVNKSKSTNSEMKIAEGKYYKIKQKLMFGSQL